GHGRAARLYCRPRVACARQRRPCHMGDGAGCTAHLGDRTCPGCLTRPGRVGARRGTAAPCPALPGAILGIPVGIGLYDAVGRHGSTVPPPPALLGVLIVTLLLVGGAAG